MQMRDDKRRHPVGFYSTTFTQAERNYDIYDLELLAIVKALRHWRLLLAGSPHKIKVFSDHINLQYWRDLQKISRRVACKVLELADYDIKIHHLKGSANGRADALSRRPDFDQGEGDNEGMVVLPDALFAQLAKPEIGEEQDKGKINLWVNPHQLVKKQPSQDVLHGDAAEEELGLACLISSYTLPHQNSQPGRRGRQTARSKVLSRRARDM